MGGTYLEAPGNFRHNTIDDEWLNITILDTTKSILTVARHTKVVNSEKESPESQTFAQIPASISNFVPDPILSAQI